MLVMFVDATTELEILNEAVAPVAYKRDSYYRLRNSNALIIGAEIRDET